MSRTSAPVCESSVEKGTGMLAWLRFERETTRPFTAASRAAVGSLLLWCLGLGVLAGLLRGGQALAAVLIGAGAVLASALISWVLAWMAEGRHLLSLPTALLLGYAVKILAALVTLVLMSQHARISAGWALTGVLGAVLLSVGTQTWVVWRLRVPYFDHVERH